MRPTISTPRCCVSRRRDAGRRRSARGEALAVAHVRPDVGLDVGQDLAEVVAVVMDPFVEEIADRQIADLRMVAAARQIRLAQALDETDAVVAKRGQLGEERAAVRVTVSAGARDLVLVPALELRVATREDDPDAATEAA